MITEVVTNLVLCLVISTKEAPSYAFPYSLMTERYVELKATNNEKPLPDGRMPNESTCGFALQRRYMQSIYDTMCAWGGYDESRWPDAIPISCAKQNPDKPKGTVHEWSVSDKPIGYLHKEAFLKECDRVGVWRASRHPKGTISKELFDAITPEEWEMVRKVMLGL